MLTHRTVIRSLEDANRVAQVGMLRGAFFGAALGLPAAACLGLLGTWLDAKTAPFSGRPGPFPSYGEILGLTVLVTGAFVGAFCNGQRALMSEWLEPCRARVWAEWRRALVISVPLGLPLAGLLGWLAWRSEHSWSLSLGIGLEACWIFAGIGTLVAYHQGEKAARQLLEEAGCDRFGWFQYGAPVVSRGGESDITDRTGVQKQTWAPRDERVREGEE